MRDIKSLIEQGAICAPSFVESSYLSEQNKELPMHLLNFRATMTLITGYDAKRRAKVIDRVYFNAQTADKNQPTIKK